MSLPLALAVENPDAVRRVGQLIGDKGASAPPTLVIALLAVAVMFVSGYYAWRWARRLDSQPGRAALTRRLAKRVGLRAGQRRLLCRLGRLAALEPMVGLLSPALLDELLRRARQGGLKLSPRQLAQVRKIRRAVAQAVGRETPAPPDGPSGRQNEAAKATPHA